MNLKTFVFGRALVKPKSNVLREIPEYLGAWLHQFIKDYPTCCPAKSGCPGGGYTIRPQAITDVADGGQSYYCSQCGSQLIVVEGVGYFATAGYTA